MIEKIIKKMNLGILKEEPVKLTGGLMHATFKICTDKGDFIIKLLNPNIMKRNTALSNYEKADKLESILKVHDINILPAIEFDNFTLQKIDNQYFYVFEFYDGVSLKFDEIKEIHCKLIANELSKIHNIDIKNEKYIRDEIHIDWNYYIELAKTNNLKIFELLNKNISILNESMTKGNIAIKKLPEISCICHNDMDSKNVLWIKDDFKIIDLECLGYSNPYIEFFQLALCWSGYEQCDINYNLLKTFISTYMENTDILNVDWETIYYGNFGRLEWLEFNLKRAFMIECDSEEEQKIGINEVIETINHVVYYDKNKEAILKCFS